ncbi:hypothetical protein OYC64_008719 [Pagothenia borchgrevinki]|uniref:Uncharacterized protein n=1 Tax=Pagothenia borchgrevinki TaxID=8213 RepID=A0ABD2G6H7_PAGBO
MPHKSKKEKETKPGRSKKSGSKNGPADDQDGSNKKVPPATQLMRVKQPGSHSAVKREKRFSTSSFPLSANRELQKLAALAGRIWLKWFPVNYTQLCSHTWMSLVTLQRNH